MPQKKNRLSFSAKSRKKHNRPPIKIANALRRSREYLTSAEVKAVREAAKAAGRNGERDHLLILMTYRHALRVSEAVDLRWEQINFDEGKLHVNRLKNGEASVHYLEGDELRMLRKQRRENTDTAFVFCSERKSPLSARAARDIITRAGELAGIEFPIHPHMLRHAKGYQLASRKVDTRAIQAYLGHKNIQHTVAYTKLDPSRFKGFGRD